MKKIVLCGALFSLISLSAQDTSAVEKKLAETKARLDDVMADGFKVLSSSMINGPTVKGAPYSAQAVNEMVQTLGDGNRITNSTSTSLYRDSQGRERREEASADGTLKSIFITDPVDSVSYALNPNTKIAHKSTQRNVGFAYATGIGEGGGAGHGRGGVAIAETRTFVMNSTGGGPETFVFANQEVSSAKVKPVIEHLGTRVIEGVSAEGTRTTVTIPAGQIGNQLPIETVTERWYSPELQVTVMNKRTDPRMGTTTYTLKNIIRSEPSPTMFEVPADYKLIEPETRRNMIIKEDQ